jgi:hypothetical protein
VPWLTHFQNMESSEFQEFRTSESSDPPPKTKKNCDTQFSRDYHQITVVMATLRRGGGGGGARGGGGGGGAGPRRRWRRRRRRRRRITCSAIITSTLCFEAFAPN